jgi:hypothetical protein
MERHENDESSTFPTSTYSVSLSPKNASQPGSAVTLLYLLASISINTFINDWYI